MFNATVTTDSATLATSLLDWWALAGVDMAVVDEARGWLAREPVAVAAKEAAPVVAAVPVVEVAPTPVEIPVAPMPDDLEAFLDWLAADPDQPEAAFSRQRVMPRVMPGAELLIVTDMPSADDMVAGELLSGADQRLIAAMLRAAGVDSARASVASLLTARPAGGVIDDAMAAKAVKRLNHLIGLLAPRTAILLGDRTGRVLEGTSEVDDASPTPSVNHWNGTISAMTLPAPFVLLKHPQSKAAAWGQLRELAVRR